MSVNLFNILIDFITKPIFVSIIGVISFISAIIALIVAWMAYQLQKKSDKDIQRIEKDIGRLEKSAQSISETQDKLAFETEKNRLINISENLNVSGEDKSKLKSGIMCIFYNEEYKLRFIKNDQSIDATCKIDFIKESMKEYALPKRFYPYDRKQDFPYCYVYVTNIRNKNDVEKGYYYLSYEAILKKDNSREVKWYIAKKYPISNGFEIDFWQAHHKSRGDTADDFCKKC